MQRGEASNVLDLSDGNVSIQADGSETFSNAGQGSSNLITYQGDLNYDGRVSMKDLAYLNAGAARQQLVESNDENGNAVQVASQASYARDVDADFSGKIDLADLSVLDDTSFRWRLQRTDVTLFRFNRILILEGIVVPGGAFALAIQLRPGDIR